MHARQHLELRDIEVLRRAHTGQNRLRRARSTVNIESKLNHPLDDALNMFFGRTVLHRYDHCFRFTLVSYVPKLVILNLAAYTISPLQCAHHVDNPLVDVQHLVIGNGPGFAAPNMVEYSPARVPAHRPACSSAA